MFMKFTLTLVTIILLVTLAGCGAKSTPIPSPDNTQSNGSDSNAGAKPTENQQLLPLISGKAAKLQLDDSADGTTQQIKKGEVMAITLESNITTGYSWFAVISNPKVLVQMGEPEYQEPSSSSGTPLLGAAGMQTFLLQAAETGTATVTLEYKRSFEETVTPEKTITIMVQVDGKAANLQLDASADGTTQQVKKSDVIAITLESNPSTGYGWYATISDPKVLLQMGEPQYQESSSSTGTPLLGAAGKQVFYFQAAETGTATVTLQYMRSFETNVSPEKTITISVDVK